MSYWVIPCVSSLRDGWVFILMQNIVIQKQRPKTQDLSSLSWHHQGILIKKVLAINKMVWIDFLEEEFEMGINSGIWPVLYLVLKSFVKRSILNIPLSSWRWQIQLQSITDFTNSILQTKSSHVTIPDKSCGLWEHHEKCH